MRVLGVPLVVFRYTHSTEKRKWKNGIFYFGIFCEHFSDGSFAKLSRTYHLYLFKPAWFIGRFANFFFCSFLLAVVPNRFEIAFEKDTLLCCAVFGILHSIQLGEARERSVDRILQIFQMKIIVKCRWENSPATKQFGCRYDAHRYAVAEKKKFFFFFVPISHLHFALITSFIRSYQIPIAFTSQRLSVTIYAATCWIEIVFPFSHISKLSENEWGVQRQRHGVWRKVAKKFHCNLKESSIELSAIYWADPKTLNRYTFSKSNP